MVIFLHLHLQLISSVKPCECSKVYIGETGRAMKDRIKEHNRDIWLAHTQTSAVSEHTNETGDLPL